MFADLSEFYEWFDERRGKNDYRVTKTALDRMAGWRVDPGDGGIRHHSGKFFSVLGLEVATDHR
ncbi:oxidase EvaA, partial [Amycolatopsis xylanica]